MATRYNINDFALANPIYVGGTVSFYTVSGGAKTTTLATLYSASTGTTTLANPRTLDSDGKFSVPVYTEVPVIATVSGLTIADHDTGIMGLAEGAAATSAAAAAVSAAAALVSENNAETAETNAVAAVAGIGHRAAATVGGTADAITATFSPAFASLAASAGIVLAIPLAGSNTVTTPTLAIDGFTAKTIVKNSGAALVAGSIPGGDFVGLFVYDASLDKFQMLNPTPVLGAEYQAYDATLASLAGLTLSQGALLTATGADAGAVLAKGTALQVLRMNAGATAPEWGSSIIPFTPQASTSGTSIDFTVTAGAKQVVIAFKGVSTNGTSALLMQLGDSGGVETSGYVSATQDYGSAATSTAGFILNNASVAAENYNGAVALSIENAAAFSWVGSGTLASSLVNSSAGSKSLSAELTTIRITTANGTDAFDGGEIGGYYVI